MKGEIVFFNSQRRMAAALTENNEYTVFELLDHEIEIGDFITGNLESLGGETFYNETSFEEMDVFVEEIQVSEKSALQMISWYLFYFFWNIIQVSDYFLLDWEWGER